MGLHVHQHGSVPKVLAQLHFVELKKARFGGLFFAYAKEINAPQK